jgi:hypothetical protein
MKLFVFMSLTLGLGFVSTGAKAQVVDKVTVYRHFPKGGKTAGLTSLSDHPENKTLVDTSNVNRQNQLTPADFTQLLKTAKKKKHFQQKIAGAVFAGKMSVDQQSHSYLYCGPAVLIDLTARINYWLAPAAAAAFDAKSKQLPLAR